jgi:type IV secretory pathway VirB3-like protein
LKQRVLKALANPPRIFYVAYNLAVLNFLIWFLLFVAVMIIFLITTKDIPMITPLVFIGVLFLSHSILAFYSKKEPQIAQIIFSSFRIFKNKIPGKLVV